MAIKAVYFDAAGTLIKTTRHVSDSYSAIAAKYGKQVSPRDLSERFHVCFDGAPRLAFPRRAPEEVDRLERDWWKALVIEIFAPWGRFDNFDEYFDELFTYFAQPSAWALFPEVLETLSALKERGLMLAVISNFDSRLVPILNGLGAGAWFDDILVSSRVGYAKPDRKIFDAALARHGLTAESALHIGDSETNDLRGAQNAGLAALLIDRSLAASPPVPDRIASLGEIVWRVDR